jgi:HK97 family phage portal protein
MSVKTTLARWLLPAALSERMGMIERAGGSRDSGHSVVPDSSWAWQGYRRNPGLLAIEAYERVGWVYACVRALARNAQQVPFLAKRIVPGRGQGRIEQLPDSHPLSQLLLHPNEEEDWSGLIEASVTGLELRGESFWELVGELNGTDGNPRPARIFARPPEWLYKVDIENDAYKQFRLRLPQYGEELIIPGNKGVLLKYFNPHDPYRGLAPLKAAFQAADTYYAAQLLNAQFFNSGGLPSVVLGYQKNAPYREVDRTVRERIRAEMHKYFSSAWRKVAVLDPGMVILNDGTAVKDMDFAKLLEVSKTEILAVYGVPPIILGEVENANRANSTEQRAMFWQERIVPIDEDIASYFNRKVAPRFGQGVFIQPDFSQVPALRQSMKEMADGVIPWVTADIMVINEARRDYLGKDPVPWGDEPFHPQPEMNSPPPDNSANSSNSANQDGGKISPETVRMVLKQWKNSTLSRMREGVRDPLLAFPPGRESKNAARRFGMPQRAAWELARAISVEVALYWETEAPEDGVAQLFEKTLELLPREERGESECERNARKLTKGAK